MRPSEHAADVKGQSMGEVVSACVIVPTIGRADLLGACLESLRNCRPRATEIVVVDASGSDEIASLTSQHADVGARMILDEGKGTGNAVNLGLEAAAQDVVLMTHDDCRVATDWVAVGVALMAERPDGIVTGRVLPDGDPRQVSGLISDPQPHDYTGTLANVLLAHNMVGSRRALLEFGGFDERIVPASEDDDLCFRWLRAGRSLRYAPDLTVWHREWRNPREIRKLYRGYGRGNGMVYAKHLLAGETDMIRFLAADFGHGVRGVIAALLRPELRWWDSRLGLVPGLPLGLWRGLRTFGPRPFAGGGQR
jgi:GT2 family glycosyltransferase